MIDPNQLTLKAGADVPSQSPQPVALTPSSPEIDAGDQFLADALAVNLDEIIQEPIAVAFSEWEMVEVAGKQVPRRTVRHVSIDAMVPSEIYDLMVLRRQQAGNDTVKLLAMLNECVLKVWQLTEPEMTAERLGKGLTGRQKTALFGRFFQDEYRARQASTPVPPAAPTTPSTVLSPLTNP